MRDILFFDAMLTPKIITIVYWLGLIAVVVTGLGMMFTEGAAGFFTGIFMIIFGAIGVRIWCELLIVMFKIYESLRTLVERDGPSNIVD